MMSCIRKAIKFSRPESVEVNESLWAVYVIISIYKGNRLLPSSDRDYKINLT